MKVSDRRSFTKGVVMTIIFFVVLTLMFSRLFKGRNAFEAADGLFNSMAKGSTYYIPGVVRHSQQFMGRSFEVKVALKDPAAAENTRKLVSLSGGAAAGEGTELRISGDLGRIAAAAVEDADAMFHNREGEVAAKYGLPGKAVLSTWWNLFKEAGRDLTRQKHFDEAAFLEEANKKAIEVGYNFYQIDPMHASSNAGILSLTLIFYVIYTLWWGFAVYYIFEGVGMKMKAGAKKEI